MSKSIKFKNNNYLDSSSIVHKRELLSDIINKLLFKKNGTVTPDDSEKFKITRNKVRQIRNIVFIDLTIKLLTDIPKVTQYHFEISGVDACPIPTFLISSYSDYDEWGATEILYTYCENNDLWIANKKSSSVAGGYWNVHLSYMVD